MNGKCYGLVINRDGKDYYSSFVWDDPERAIEQAERYPGVIRVEEAHAGTPPIWERK